MIRKVDVYPPQGARRERRVRREDVRPKGGKIAFWLPSGNAEPNRTVRTADYLVKGSSPSNPQRARRDRRPPYP